MKAVFYNQCISNMSWIGVTGEELQRITARRDGRLIAPYVPDEPLYNQCLLDIDGVLRERASRGVKTVIALPPSCFTGPNYKLPEGFEHRMIRYYATKNICVVAEYDGFAYDFSWSAHK
jgi:hypothetical protein